MQTTDVRDSARQAVEGSRSFIAGRVEDGTKKLGGQIASMADELRTVGDQLRSAGPASAAAPYVDQGVQMAERFGRYLTDADAAQLVGDLETIARRQPWAVAAGALALGFAASRFLKTSSVRRYHGSAANGYGDDDDFGFAPEGRYAS